MDEMENLGEEPAIEMNDLDFQNKENDRAMKLIVEVLEMNGVFVETGLNACYNLTFNILNKFGIPQEELTPLSKELGGRIQVLVDKYKK